MECDKYKTSAIIGAILFLIIGLLKLINRSYIDTTIAIVLVLFFGILGLYLLLPYIVCITDYNNKHKPPFV